MNNRREFFLLSGANAISSIHVDNGAQLTWISILEGRKIWYFPRKITSESVRLLALAGSQGPQGYEEGWARVELCPGDLLYVRFIPIHQKILLIYISFSIMPPSCPHAVFTPDVCLAVGGHFYTSAHLGSTLRGLKLQEDFPEICNEDLQPDFYNLLRIIFQNLGSINFYTQKADILSSLPLFLNTFDGASLATLFRNRRGSNFRCDKHQLSRVMEQLELRIASQDPRLISSRVTFIDALERLQKQLLENWEDE